MYYTICHQKCWAMLRAGYPTLLPCCVLLYIFFARKGEVGLPNALTSDNGVFSPAQWTEMPTRWASENVITLYIVNVALL